MAEKDLILDFSEYDLDQILADKEEIRRYTPQRFGMEQLTAVVYDDCKAGICVGYNDLSNEEFWVEGHMPGMPLMPGVLVCEAAAQLCTFQVKKNDTMKVDLVGFGGIDKVRFRGIIRPGDRLVIVTKQLKLRPGRMIRSQFQGFVNEELVAEGEIIGISLPIDALQPNSSSTP